MEQWILFIQIEENELLSMELKSVEQLCTRIREHGWQVVRLTERNLLEGLRREHAVAIVQNVFWYSFLEERDIAVVGWEYENSLEHMPGKYILQGLDSVGIEYLTEVYRRFHGIPLDILETKRCLLREQTLEDLENLFAIYEQPHMTDYIEPLYEWKEEVVYQKAYIEHVYGLYGYGLWAVIHKESGKLIGRAGIETRENCKENEVEMGYAISTEYQNQGYATEVCMGILEYVKEHLPEDTVICRVDNRNVYSRKLLTKLGFTMRQGTGWTEDKEIVYERVPL